MNRALAPLMRNHVHLRYMINPLGPRLLDGPGGDSSRCSSRPQA